MDCNKTINFMKERRRMCNSYEDECIECPLNECCIGGVFWAENSKQAIEIVQKWSDEHPLKTYAQDFFEKFPNADRGADQIPFICRRSIYGGECDKGKQCSDCWNEPMEE